MVVLYDTEPLFFMNEPPRREERQEMGLQLLSRWTKLHSEPLPLPLPYKGRGDFSRYQAEPGKEGNCLFFKVLGLIQRSYLTFCFPLSICLLLASSPAWTAPQPQNPNASDLDLSPEAIKNSLVLQRWLRQVPNVLDDIANDPSFRTRLRLGYSFFPSTDAASGWNIGFEDIFINSSRFTVSGEYQAAFNGEREAYGIDLHYYVRPLGKYINFAPLVGYRHLETDKYSTDGLNVGVRLLLVLSRSGAADISLTQSWVSPGTDEEVGLTTLSFGYAVTRNLRLSTDIQKQNSPEDKDSRVGIVLEWMP